MHYYKKINPIYSRANGNLNRYSYKMFYVSIKKEVNRAALRKYESCIINALYQDTILNNAVEILSDGLDPLLKLTITI